MLGLKFASPEGESMVNLTFVAFQMFLKDGLFNFVFLNFVQCYLLAFLRWSFKGVASGGAIWGLSWCTDGDWFKGGALVLVDTYIWWDFGGG